MWQEKLQEMPRVKMVMTPFPYSVEETEPLEKAREMMESYGIHHLPVMADGKLVGAITHRDVRRAFEQGSAKGGRSGTVLDVPREEVYVADLSEPLDRVLLKMAEKRLGVVLVVKDERLAGIFTLTDVCRSFSELLRREFPPSGGDEAA